MDSRRRQCGMFEATPLTALVGGGGDLMGVPWCGVVGRCRAICWSSPGW
jgi:hypothetical protein